MVWCGISRLRYKPDGKGRYITGVSIIQSLQIMKKQALLLCLILSAATLSGADFDVRKFGAKGDGTTKNTTAIQKAIDACTKAGGGRVVLMDGVYMTGPIRLKDGVNLYIDGTAKLLASPDIKDYPNWPDPKHIITENMPRGHRNACIIFADEAERISITGRGVIDANGTYHIRKTDQKAFNGRWKYKRIYGPDESLPRVVLLTGCKDVLIEDVTMTNQPAGWSYWIHDCDRVTVRGLQILANLEYPNNDGIHVNCSRDVTISDCHIETGDDAIIIRANSRSLHEKKPMERVTVTNCVLRSYACCIRIGWTNDGVMRHCTFSNLVMTKSHNGIAVHLPKISGNDWGNEATLVEDMAFSNIVMDDIYGTPISVSIDRDPGTRVEAIRNLRFSNIHTRGASFPRFHGREGNPVQNFSFDNCSFVRETPPEKENPEIFRYAEGFSFNATTFTSKVTKTE